MAKLGKKKIFGFDNFEGDKGIIIAKSYDDAARIYHEKYCLKITTDHFEYMAGGCYLTEFGKIENNTLYVNAEW